MTDAAAEESLGLLQRLEGLRTALLAVPDRPGRSPARRAHASLTSDGVPDAGGGRRPIAVRTRGAVSSCARCRST
jgi:hypothetical protein